MGMKERTYSGTKDPVITDRERLRLDIVRRAASEGIVLLKNEGVLPIESKQKAALYGTGSIHAIKGGIGSGDVNSWNEVSIYQGLTSAGVIIANEEDVVKAIYNYKESRIEWRDRLLKRREETGKSFFELTDSEPYRFTEEIPIEKETAEDSDLTIYVISRISGEGHDRKNERGDYLLSEKEEADLRKLAGYSDKIAVLINAGGQIDMKEILLIPSVKAVINISQGGMELGHAVADVITGRISPCGKLTQTWAYNYRDYPGAKDFDPFRSDQIDVLYEEGIYVGYRYFDSFGIRPLYPFGYGMSYTSFELKAEKVMTDGTSIGVTVSVTNTGKAHPGKEVIQIYAACPQEGLSKEFKRLIGFAKTRELQPGETQTLTITMPTETIASYDMDIHAYVAERGEYAIFIGNSSENIMLAGVLVSDRTVVLQEVQGIAPLNTELNEMVRPDEVIAALTAKWKAEAAAKGIEAVPFEPKGTVWEKAPLNPSIQKGIDIASHMTNEDLARFLLGEISKGQDNLKRDELVTTGIYIPGCAGETSNILEEEYGVPGVPMVDGPAGVRIMQTYQVDKKTGWIYGEGLDAALVESGLFCDTTDHKNAETWYQYTSAVPIGTLLAQSFDPELLEETGRILGAETRQFNAAWLLGPGMNIQRDPLCGRNYEYYSEDPLVSGVMAAAVTKGIQSVPGVGAVIKHLACNNKEENRFSSNSVISVRALREIYLRAFEIAVRTSQPMCIMTSYNMINSVKSANNHDICTKVVREEWDFRGIFMTDWTATTAGCAPAHLCAKAGVDLIMPGSQLDMDDIRLGLDAGMLSEDTARNCAARIIALALQTARMEDASSYSEQFDLKPYLYIR